MVTDEADDKVLVESAQRDPRRFADLYARHFDRVYAFIARRVPARLDAQDLTAEVFQQALAALPRFEWRGAPFAAWLYRIAANAVADHYERHAREQHALPAIEAPAEPPAEVERLASVYRAVRSACGSARTRASPTSRERSDAARARSSSSSSAPSGASGRDWMGTMPERDPAERLDEMVEAILSGARAPGGDDSSLTDLLRLAADLRGLPDEEFRERLGATLASAATRALGGTDMITTATGPLRAGFHTVTPYLRVERIADLLDFATRAFGPSRRCVTPGQPGACTRRRGSATRC